MHDMRGEWEGFHDRISSGILKVKLIHNYTLYSIVRGFSMVHHLVLGPLISIIQVKT
jgi:hypothetical protein